MDKIKFTPPIWVYCETDGAGLTHGSYELLGKTRSLAEEMGCQVLAVMFAEMDGEGAAQSAISYGADVVYCFSTPCGAGELARAEAIAEKMGEGRPWAFLFPATARSRTVAAILSARLKTGLTADCMALSVENGLLKQTRPAFGGSLMAEVFCRRSFPQMATVRSGVFPLPCDDKERQGQVFRFRLEERESPAKLVGKNGGSGYGRNLNEAEVVLAGGMGLGGKEGFRLLEKAAGAVGAVPAASRAAVNAGLAPYTWQVGQSGRSIRPKLYIACGISGAVQHMAGIHGAGTIIAVNSDRKAPIFDFADIGICGDCRDFLQMLLEIVGESDNQDMAARQMGKPIEFMEK